MDRYKQNPGKSCTLENTTTEMAKNVAESHLRHYPVKIKKWCVQATDTKQPKKKWSDNQ